jgi:hypothetical protein
LSEIQTKLCLAWFIARDTVPHTTAHRYRGLKTDRVPIIFINKYFTQFIPGKQEGYGTTTESLPTPCINAATCGQVQVPEPTSVMGLLAISALGAGSVLQRKLLK